jgi:Putative transposase DNA-binding domain
VSDGANTQVLVWRYGARKGVSIPPEVDEQLRLAHELREHFVELVHERERAVAAVWTEHAQVAAAQEAAEEAQAALDALLERGAEERMRGLKRTTSVELHREIAEARARTRQAKERAREAKKRAYARAAPALHEARAAERKARKAAYGEFVQRRGLYWATFNDVARQHDLADRRISAARKQGRPARFRHHRYDGTGRIAVQLKREQGRPERTAELLSTSKSPWWGVLRLPTVAATDSQDWAGLARAEQRRRGRAEIAVRVASRQDRTPVLWEIPVQIHRPIPPGAEILAAEIVITRVADERRVSANLTVRAHAALPRTGPAVAVDIGWRSMPDGSLRVAYWRGSKAPMQPVRVPEHLASVLLVHASGREGEVRLPASWRELDNRIAQLRSGRDKDLNRIKATTRAYLRTHPHVAVALELAPDDVVRWRSPARMVSLGGRLADIEDAGELREEIAAWERQDRHLWRWEANEREQLTLRRRDAYRAIAALITDPWPHALLETRFVSHVIHRPVGERTDGYQAEYARAQAKLAAPAELAEAIRNAAMGHGGSVAEVDSRLSTRRHHVCNQVVPSETDTATSVVVECPHCGVTFDQDQNAVMNMLREHSGTDRTAQATHTRDGSPGSAVNSRRSRRTQSKVPVR